MAVAVTLVLLGPQPAWAHPGGAPAWSWGLDAATLANLLLACWLYGQGMARLRQRAGTSRVVPNWQAAAFAGGIAVLFAALLSPLDRANDELASLHMVQHLLLMMVAAPLCVLGSPARVVPWGLSARWRRAASRGAAARRACPPPLAWALHAGTLWFWHVPLFYDAALEIPLVHAVQHLSFFATALLFWDAVLDRSPRPRPGPLAGVLYLFATSLHSGALGVLMTFARTPWYPAYADRAARWGLTPLEDQQLAGMIMWMPGSMMYATAAVALLAYWLALQAEVDSPGVEPVKPGFPPNG